MDEFTLHISAWDESKHPRDEKGKWTWAGAAGAAITGTVGLSVSAIKLLGSVAWTVLSAVGSTAATAVRFIVAGVAFEIAKAMVGAGTWNSDVEIVFNEGDKLPQYILDAKPIVEAMAKGDTQTTKELVAEYASMYRGNPEVLAVWREIGRQANMRTNEEIVVDDFLLRVFEDELDVDPEDTITLDQIEELRGVVRGLMEGYPEVKERGEAILARLDELSEGVSKLRTNAPEWEEEEHPRDAYGRFAPKGGGGGSGGGRRRSLGIEDRDYSPSGRSGPRERTSGGVFSFLSRFTGERAASVIEHSVTAAVKLGIVGGAYIAGQRYTGNPIAATALTAFIADALDVGGSATRAVSAILGSGAADPNAPTTVLGGKPPNPGGFVKPTATGPASGYIAGNSEEFSLEVNWDESQHPRDDHGRFAPGGDFAARGALAGGALGLLTGTAVAATMVLAPGTSRIVRLLKKVTGVPSIKPGAWNPQNIAFAGSGAGTIAGSIVGGGLDAAGYRGNAASITADFENLKRLAEAGDEAAFVAALQEFDQKWDDGDITGLEAALNVNWDESQHPRDDDGKFTESGSGGSAGGVSGSASIQEKFDKNPAVKALHAITKAAFVAAGAAAGLAVGAYAAPVAVTAAYALGVAGKGIEGVIAGGLARAALKHSAQAAMEFGNILAPGASILGAGAGVGLGGYLAAKTNQEGPDYILDLAPVMEAVAKRDIPAATAAMMKYREKYQGDEKVIAALTQAAADMSVAGEMGDNAMKDFVINILQDNGNRKYCCVGGRSSGGVAWG